MEKIEECVGEFSISCSFRNVGDGFVWALVGVYGTTNFDSERMFLWEELAGLISWWNMS